MQKTELNTRSSYKKYKKEAQAPVDASTFVKIANGYMQFLFDKVMQAEEVTLPCKMGTLSVRGVKRKLTFDEEGKPKLPINWRATKELWNRDPQAKLNKKVIYCTNEETGGVVYRIHWSRNRSPIENKLYYGLRMTRANKRAVHFSIKAGTEFLIKNV